MVHAQLVDAITNKFPSPTLPKQPGKLSYVSIRDTHCLLTANTESIESPYGRGQNGHLGLVLTTTQYTLISQYPFICLTNPGRTPHILTWTTPFNEKALLREHAKQRRQYDKCRNVDAPSRISSSQNLKTHTSPP